MYDFNIQNIVWTFTIALQINIDDWNKISLIMHICFIRASKIEQKWILLSAINGSISCESIHLPYGIPEPSGTTCFKGRFLPPGHYYRTKESVTARVAAWFMHQTRWIQFMQILLQLNWLGSEPDRSRCWIFQRPLRDTYVAIVVFPLRESIREPEFRPVRLMGVLENN